MKSDYERHSTYHDKWYQVEDLTPSLRKDVRISRQLFWGVAWYIVSEPDSNTYFRLAKGGYVFVTMLDGKRTIQEVWELCQQSDDEALTQGEIIGLLGRLHGAGLLSVNLPADTDALLRRKQEKRLKKVSQTLSSFLFLRIPLWAPDVFFSRYQHLGGLVFHPYGIALWCLVGFYSLYTLFINWNQFSLEASKTLAPSNLLWVYVVIILAKIVHECGHAFACKYFSKRDGLRGDVHTMGIMLLLFAPVPFIDVSSSVQIRSRFARAFVGLAGMYCELFLAFIAIILWANTAEDTAIHLLARNCVVITSVTTIFFNINPLLRFDGYFAFSDLVGLPNLYQRSQAYCIYLFKRIVLGLQQATTVVSRTNERIIYPIYASCAFIYRIIITVGIFVILEDSFAILGTALAMGLFFIWFVLPSIKGLIYLISGSELSGMRTKAISRFLALLGVMAILLLAIPVENAIYVEGVVESREQYGIFAEEEGTLADFLPTDQKIAKGGALVSIINPGLLASLERMALSVAVSKAQFDYANDRGDTNAAGMRRLEFESNVRQLEILHVQASRQTIIAPMDGVWVAPDLTYRQGKWIAKGDPLGSIYAPDKLRLRVLVDQFDAARLFAEKISSSKFCISNRMDIRNEAGELFDAQLESAPVPAGRRELFHPSLSTEAGGNIPTIKGPQGKTLTATHFFELRLLPEENTLSYLFPGQKVLVRIVFGKQAIGIQWIRRLRQFFTTK